MKQRGKIAIKLGEYYGEDFKVLNEQRNLVRYDTEFTEYKDLDVEDTVYDELVEYWDVLAAIAREGFEKFGRGFIFIKAHMYSMELEWGKNFNNKQAVYIPFSSVELSNDSLFWEESLELYDPETEVIFLIEFKDGHFRCVASSGENLKTLALAA